MLLPGHRNSKGKNICGGKARVNLQELCKSLQHQARADQKNKTQGNLCAHEEIAVAPAGRTGRLPNRIQRPRQINFSGTQGGGQTKKQTSRNRYGEGEGEDGCVHLNGGEALHFLRLHGQKQTERAPSETDGRNRTTAKEQDTLREQLANQAAACSAHCIS